MIYKREMEQAPPLWLEVSNINTMPLTFAPLLADFKTEEWSLAAANQVNKFTTSRTLEVMDRVHNIISLRLSQYIQSASIETSSGIMITTKIMIDSGSIIMLFCTQYCFQAHKCMRIQAKSSIQQELLIKNCYRFCGPLSYLYSLEVLFTELFFSLSMILVW